jgi:hypothetical protein
MQTEIKFKRLIAESHRRQFNGEDWQAVANDIAEENGIAWDSDEYAQLTYSPTPECDCGFCARAPWRD